MKKPIMRKWLMVKNVIDMAKRKSLVPEPAKLVPSGKDGFTEQAAQSHLLAKGKKNLVPG